jgi:hypothetical protein
MTRNGLAKHLATCSARQQRIAQTDHQHGKERLLYHVQVQDAWSGDFWLHLEIDGVARLLDLDAYLRTIWLECCGHLSQFSIGGWDGEPMSMECKIADVFPPGVVVTHIYDFGTSSETLIKVVGTRTGRPLSKYPIFLMARNHAPEEECMECQRRAAALCLECVYEHELSGFLCDHHAQDHPHDNYGDPMPLVNSPRVGMCGYEGPAEPPY